MEENSSSQSILALNVTDATVDNTAAQWFNAVSHANVTQAAANSPTTTTTAAAAPIPVSVLIQYYILIGWYLATPVPGIILNFLVIVISVKRHLVEGQYKYFLLNIAVIDFFLCCLFLFVNAYGQFYPCVGWCAIVGGVTATAGICGITALPLLSFNRYISICHHKKYDKMFTSFFVFLICATPTLIVLIIVICMFLYPSGITVQKASLFFLCGLALIATVVFNALIYRKLKHHQLNTTSIIRSGENADHYAQIIRVSLVQATAPVFLQAPLLCIQIYALAVASISPYISVVAELLFYTNPSVNALVALYVVKPYRNAAIRIFKRLCCIKMEHADDTVATTGQNNNNNHVARRKPRWSSSNSDRQKNTGENNQDMTEQTWKTSSLKSNKSIRTNQVGHV